jgi:hypothetical protein
MQDAEEGRRENSREKKEEAHKRKRQTMQRTAVTRMQCHTKKKRKETFIRMLRERYINMCECVCVHDARISRKKKQPTRDKIIKK